MPMYGATTELTAKVEVDDIIEYAKNNLEPWDIFEQDDLVEAVADHLDPEEVFEEKVLVEWALSHGFEKVEASA